jgi:hypothetical protein
MAQPIKVIDGFLANLHCTGTTPRISISDRFSQTVSVSCSSELGPVSVDLAAMRVSIAGKDIWNSPTDHYLGRNFYQITGARR